MAVLDFAAIVREHDLRELHPGKFFRARPFVKKSLEQWYFPGVAFNSKVRQRLLAEHAEFLELGEDMDVHRKIAADISRCHTILTSSLWGLPQAHDYCRQGLFCSFCINQRLQRLSEQFNQAVDEWRGSRGMQNVQMHDFVFHPAWYNPDKRCSDVPRAFEMIREFRKQVGDICSRLNKQAAKANKDSQIMGPILWGIHCSKPRDTFEDQVVPIPHLHLCVITGEKFRVSPLKGSLRSLTGRMLNRKQPDPGNPLKKNKAIHYKKGDLVSYDADPDVIPAALADHAAYVGRTVKVGSERAELMTALAGRAVQMYAGKISSGILSIRGKGIRRRDPAAEASPTFSNKPFIYHRNLADKEWYVRIYRNPACFAASDFDR